MIALAQALATLEIDSARVMQRTWLPPLQLAMLREEQRSCHNRVFP
jgi:hypothetical protein